LNTEFPMLDMPTMSLASSVSGFLMAATMLGIRYAGMQARAVLDWALAGAAFGLGYLLASLVLSAVWLGSDGTAVALSNALVLTGHGYVLVGVQRYLGMRVRTGPLLALVGVLIVSGIAFDPLREMLPARIVLFSGLFSVLTGWSGILLWRSRRPGMRVFHRLAAGVLLGFAGILACRLAIELLNPITGALLAQPAAQGLGFLAAMIYGFLLTMAFAVMLFREKQVELADLARTDPLTGMNNRLSLDEIAEKCMQRAERRDQPLSLLLFDLDHFKRVNDDFGHQVGDRVLGEVAERINHLMRGDDVAFRFGGEEFLVLLPGAELNAAEQVAERLRRAIAEQPIEVGDQQLTLTASFGVVQYIPPQERWDDCIRRVDEALYQAKVGGRDRVFRHSLGALAAVQTHG